MELGNNITYAKRVIQIYDSFPKVTPWDFTLTTNTILGILSTICPDGLFLIDINDTKTILPKQENETKSKYLKRIRDSLAHKTKYNFKENTSDGMIKSFIIRSNNCNKPIELDILDFKIILEYLRERLELQKID